LPRQDGVIGGGEEEEGQHAAAVMLGDYVHQLAAMGAEMATWRKILSIERPSCVDGRPPCHGDASSIGITRSTFEDDNFSDLTHDDAEGKSRVVGGASSSIASPSHTMREDDDEQARVEQMYCARRLMA
jgi:hypothetical protein